MTTKKWRALLRKIRKRFPVEVTVHVRRRPMKVNQGSLTFTGRSYYVTVCSSLLPAQQIDALIHEWAHVIAIELAFVHGIQWGVSYAEICRAFDSDFTEEVKQ